jgi:hypothetical protein
MEYTMMTLHQHNQAFDELIRLTATNRNIPPAFVEKDYWLTLILHRLAHSEQSEKVVFKGGTSLSKGYGLINRFSEDIDIATIDENISGNALKTKIRAIEKAITIDLTEITDPNITSKGTLFRKSVFECPAVSPTTNGATRQRVIIEINSFANPYPFVRRSITSFIAEFLQLSNRQNLIAQYGLLPFSLNILDKRRTMIEKFVSLIRFSLSENPIAALSSKIRHFYDLYYLASDAECAKYMQTDDFIRDLAALILHDRQAFDTPAGWQSKNIAASPLITGFPELWKRLRPTYRNELVKLAFADIPDENAVGEIMIQIINRIWNEV